MRLIAFAFKAKSIGYLNSLARNAIWFDSILHHKIHPTWSKQTKPKTKQTKPNQNNHPKNSV